MADKTVTFRITGTRPLLMHKPNLTPPGPGPKKVVPTPEAEAAAGAYVLPNGQLYLRAEMFYQSFVKASAPIKAGRFSVKPSVAANLEILEEEIPLFNPETGEPITEYVIDTRRVVIKDASILRSRPRIDPPWGCELPVRYDDDYLTPELVGTIIPRAGKVVGVGDYRPGCKKPGPYGKFNAEII